MSDHERYARHRGLFGATGQHRLSGSSVGIVGLGGLGCHVAQQLAYLGVRDFVLVDFDTVSISNLNRLIGAAPGDLGVSKLRVAATMIARIQPTANIDQIERRFSAEAAPVELKRAEVIFGCLDDDVPRLALVRYASLRALPYVDLATDVGPDGEFGGRVVFAKDGERCLSCLGELDPHTLARAQMSPEQRAADDQIYGVDRGALNEGGPAVVSVNGVVGSLAVTEFMVWRTGLREPCGYLNYRGDRATVGRRPDPPERPYCHYCMSLWGSGT